MKRGAIFGDLKPKGSSRFFHKNHTEYQLRETAPLRKARVGRQVQNRWLDAMQYYTFLVDNRKVITRNCRKMIKLWVMEVHNYYILVASF